MLRVPMSVMDMVFTVRANLHLMKLVSSFAEGKYPMKVVGLDHMDVMTLKSLSSDAQLAAFAIELSDRELWGPAIVLLEACGNLRQRLALEFTEYGGLGAPPCPEMVEEPLAWDFGSGSSHLWDGLVPTSPPEVGLVIVGYRGDGGTTADYSGTIFACSGEGFVFAYTKETWYRSPESLLMDNVEWFQDDVLLSPKAIGHESTVLIARRAAYISTHGEPRDLEDGHELSVSDFGRFLRASGELACRFRWVVTQLCHGKRHPTRDDLKAIRSRCPTRPAALDWPTVTPTLYDEMKDQAPPDDGTTVGSVLWDYLKVQEVSEAVLVGIRQLAHLPVRPVDADTYNPGLAFIAKGVGAHELASDCDDLVSEARHTSLCTCSVGRVVVIPEAASGLLLPNLTKKVVASHILPFEHSTAEIIKLGPAVLRALDLDSKPNVVATLAGMLRSDVTSLTNLFGKKTLDVATPLFREQEWKISTILSKCHQEFAVDGAQVARVVISVLGQAGVQPVTGRGPYRCYMDMIHSAYRPAPAGVFIDCDRPVPLDGTNVYSGDWVEGRPPERWLMPQTAFKRLVGQPAVSILLSGDFHLTEDIPLEVYEGPLENLVTWVRGDPARRVWLTVQHSPSVKLTARSTVHVSLVMREGERESPPMVASNLGAGM